MIAKIKDLKDHEGNRIYPVTRADAVYLPNGKFNFIDELQNLREESGKTEFLEDGSIKKTLDTGVVIVTEFGDGIVTETAKTADGTPYYVKTTTFNADGSIDTKFEYSEVDDGQ